MSSDTEKPNGKKENLSTYDLFVKEVFDSKTIEMKKLAQQQSFTIEGKTYERRKIKNKEWKELENLRSDFSNEADSAKANKVLQEIYEKMALYYLGIEQKEYDELPTEDVKLILDTCAFRTTYGPAHPQ